jgi:ABC-2 type transport system ATP-binding protein
MCLGVCLHSPREIHDFRRVYPDVHRRAGSAIGPSGSWHHPPRCPPARLLHPVWAPAWPRATDWTFTIASALLDQQRQRACGADVNAIETEQLTKRFRQLRSYRDLALYPWRRPARVAVEDVTLRIGQGELFGLLGENGAGKTTLIRMLCTMLLPTSGSARVAGHDVVKEPHAVRELIGLVSGDERTFYWRLTGRQNLEFFAALYHLSRRSAGRRIDELLDTLEVASYADRRFNTYSTGIRQKFAIARGLLTDPRLLFLDEPTRALDPIAAQEVRRYVADYVVGRLGHTVLLATHMLSEAEAICHRVAIIRHGKVVAAGSIDELRSSMRLSTVFELVIEGPPNGVKQAICAAAGTPNVAVIAEGERSRIAVNLDPHGAALNRVLQAVVDAGVQVESCNTRQPTLEDVYRAAHAEN